MSKERFSEAGDDRLYYLAGYYAINPILKAGLGLKVHGEENIPISGRALIAGNHRHWLDIFVAPTVFSQRHLTMVAKKELYPTPVIGKLFEKWQSIPIDRDHPGPSTTREVLDRLDRERLVGIMPEGHRYRDNVLGPFHPGIARWARLGEAPTIPLAIRGVDGLFNSMVHRSAEAIIGKSLEFPATKKEEAEYLVELRERIQVLYDS